jgi:hypothetical protein
MPNLSKDSKSGSTRVRVPTVVTRAIDDEHLAVRFEQIGNWSRFKLILQRFRFDFVLAECQELEGQPWWIIGSSQHSELAEFCKRNGLRLVENH